MVARVVFARVCHEPVNVLLVWHPKIRANSCRLVGETIVYRSFTHATALTELVRREVRLRSAKSLLKAALVVRFHMLNAFRLWFIVEVTAYDNRYLDRLSVIN